jgi:crotonobetainyl-CoA:carnitine CoA-transferase CaiB-like acyl-CoA transferase
VIDYSMNGVVRPREGNRRRGVRQGVYPTDGDDAWLALTVRDDSDSARLAEAMGRGDLPGDHDAFDEAVAAWTRSRNAADVVAALQERNVPAEAVTTAERMYDLPGLDVRGFYQEFGHPVTGRHRYPGWPLRITPGPARHHRFGAPTLGQHNTEILSGLGLSRDDLDALRRDQVIGERAMG